MCKARATHRTQYAVCLLARRAGSAIKFDRDKIAFILALCYWLKRLAEKGGESNRSTQRKPTTTRLRGLFVGCLTSHRLVGLVVRRPPRERKIPGSNPACAGIFSGSSHTSDFKIGTPVATLPGAWCYRVSTGTGRPGVSIL